MNSYKSITLSLAVLLFSFWGQGQSISLDSCLTAAEQHWPAFKKQMLISDKAQLVEESLNKNYLPQFQLSAQASYQSEVVSFPEIPNMPAFGVDLPLDNYSAEAQINQSIWDGGQIKSAKKIQTAAHSIEMELLSMETYQLKGKIKQLYLNILLLNKNKVLIQLSINELDKVKSQIQASVNHGIVLASALDNIKAEQLKLQKQAIQTQTIKASSIHALKLLTNLDLNKNSVFALPNPIQTKEASVRPELSILNAQLDLNHAQVLKTQTQLKPKLMAFGKLGYGRPGYDFFNTDLHAYYLIGAKISWDIWDWDKNKKQQQQYGLERQIIELNKENINFQHNIEQNDFQLKIKQFEQQIELDQDIEALKQKVYQSALSQFKNGSINSTEYLKIFNEWRRSKLTTETNQLYLLQAQINYKHALGISK